jgi:crossover junction endodeoxyribonuclease RusA
MNKLTFPWPPSALKPNVKTHWTKKAKFAKEYKEVCFYLTKESKICQDTYKSLEMVFYPPNKRGFDLDNMLATMKSGIDGMCLALNIDDNCFKKISVEMSEDIGGYVKINLK